jgi:hypothetical protein
MRSLTALLLSLALGSACAQTRQRVSVQTRIEVEVVGALRADPLQLRALRTR